MKALLESLIAEARSANKIKKNDKYEALEEDDASLLAAFKDKHGPNSLAWYKAGQFATDTAKSDKYEALEAEDYDADSFAAVEEEQDVLSLIHI